MKRSVIFAGLTLLFVASVIGGLYLGYADLSLGEILHALSRGLFGKGGDDVAYAIVMDIRLPRVLLAILTGVALAVSGLIMQAVVGNPIADPYILGISSGASLGATLAIVLGLMGALGNVAVGISAFIFAEKAGAKLVMDEDRFGSEALLTKDPDVIFVVYFGEDKVKDKELDRFKSLPALKGLSAIKNNRVYPVSLSEVYASGVRTADGIDTMIKGLYPES
ncbi:Probable ABC transporter permease protein HI_1471 [Chlamydia trachomatis]|nr:Probable ABC transporter permease protein HI_1471 [Chlamydia trachomatis]